jgi:hypothetical protein
MKAASGNSPDNNTKKPAAMEFAPFRFCIDRVVLLSV